MKGGINVNLIKDMKTGNQSWEVIFNELPTMVEMLKVIP